MSESKRGNVWLASAGLVINDKGEWLVVKKKYGGLKGKWSFPAGFVDEGETIDLAAVREVKEETGIDCQVGSMIGFRTGVIKDLISDNMAIFLLFPNDNDQLLIPQTREIAEVIWRSPLDLKKDPNTSVMIKEIAEKVIDSGFEDIVTRSPGDVFGYTSYKLLFNSKTPIK